MVLSLYELADYAFSISYVVLLRIIMPNSIFLSSEFLEGQYLLRVDRDPMHILLHEETS